MRLAGTTIIQVLCKGGYDFMDSIDQEGQNANEEDDDNESSSNEELEKVDTGTGIAILDILSGSFSW